MTSSIDRNEDRVARHRRAREFARGARAAADLAHNYDSSSTQEYRLDDCILAKMNLRRTRPRRNRVRQESPAHAWMRGFAMALGEVHALLVDGNHEKAIREICRAAGVDLAALRAAGVVAYDMRRLRKAGVP